MNDQQLEAIRRQDEASEIITSGHVWKAVWYLAWPTAINTLIMTAYNVINRIFVGRLPDATTDLAAIGIGGAVLNIQFALAIGLSAGCAALVARSVGARNYGDAKESTRQSLTLSVAAGILTGAALLVFARPLVTVVGAKEAVAPIASSYTAIISCFSIPLFVYMIATTVLRSAGDVRSPLYAGAVVIGVNILFDWLLIFGVGPCPRMGVLGAAVSTGISRILGMGLTLWFVRRSALGASLEHFRFHWGCSARILNVGWPAALQNVMWTTAYAGFVKILAYLPDGQSTPAQAALTVAITIESLAFMPGVAYSTAATPLVGQNLGACKPERAEHSAWVAVGQAVAIMTVVAVMFLAIPRALALVFTREEPVVRLIVWYLRINGVSEPFLAVAMVIRGALQGAGQTRFPAWVTFATNWLFRLPLAWLLGITLGLGAAGCWVAMSATTIIGGSILASYFRWGGWRETKV